MAAQTVFGQSDAVAMELVDAFNAATTGTFCLKLLARRRFSRMMELVDLPKITDPVDIQVFGGHDQADRVGLSGTYDDMYGVHVLIQQVVGAGEDAEAQCGRLIQLRSQISEFLMSTRLDTNNAVHNIANSHVFSHRHGPEGVYDLNRLEKLNAFYSDLIVTYKAPGLRRQ